MRSTQALARRRSARTTKISAHVQVFLDPRVLILVGVQFGFVLVAYDMGVWLPLMLQAYHLSTAMIVLLTMAPYVVATIGAVDLWPAHVDRRGGKIHAISRWRVSFRCLPSSARCCYRDSLTFWR